jgi:hypothetical protein
VKLRQTMMVPRAFKKRRKKVKRSSSHFFFAILFIILTISSSSSSKVRFLQYDLTPSVATAMVDIIREFYIAKGIDFDFIIFGKSTIHINDVINEAAKQLSKDQRAIFRKHYDKIEDWNGEMSRSAIIFIDSEKNLRKLHDYTEKYIKTKSQLTNITPMQFKFLVYCEEIKRLEQLHEIFNGHDHVSFHRPADFRHYEFLIINEDSRVRLFANMLFSEHRCEVFQLAALNAFDKNSQKWMNKLENYDHYSNFHGCSLKFSSHHSSALYTKKNLHKTNEQVEFDGLLPEIVQSLAQRTNFTPHYSVINFRKGHFEHETNENFQPSRSTTTIFMTGTYDSWHSKAFYFSMPTAEVEMYFLISENDFYTNYEKLMMPFDETTWKLLFFTYGLTFGVIFVLRFCPQWFRTMVFGKGKQTRI